MDQFTGGTPGKSDELLRTFIERYGLIEDDQSDEKKIVGRSLPLLLALNKARWAARNNLHILIRGERGTGKNLLAWYINLKNEQQRDPKKFVTLNCGGLSDTLFLSTIFGHKKGAFTGDSTSWF